MKETQVAVVLLVITIKLENMIKRMSLQVVITSNKQEKILKLEIIQLSMEKEQAMKAKMKTNQ